MPIPETGLEPIIRKAKEVALDRGDAMTIRGHLSLETLKDLDIWNIVTGRKALPAPSVLEAALLPRRPSRSENGVDIDLPHLSHEAQELLDRARLIGKDRPTILHLAMAILEDRDIRQALTHLGVDTSLARQNLRRAISDG